MGTKVCNFASDFPENSGTHKYLRSIVNLR